MGICNQRTRHGAFEISSGNGLIGIYALRRARGEGGKPEPKLEAVLTRNAQRLKEKREMAKLESSADTEARSKTDKPRNPASSPCNSGEARTFMPWKIRLGLLAGRKDFRKSSGVS